MLIIDIDNDTSHLRPYSFIGDCIIDIANIPANELLALKEVLSDRHQKYTDDNFSDIWTNHNPHFVSYCRSYSGTWNITSLKANLSLEDFLKHYTTKPEVDKLHKEFRNSTVHTR